MNAYDKLEKIGTTTWDKECEIKVEHNKIKVFPTILFFIIDMGIYILSQFYI